MAGATLAAGVLAATKLSDFPTFLGEPGTDFWIVVGKDAAASDVVGAVDIAARLAELSTVEKNVPSVTTTNIEGKSMEVAFENNILRDTFKQAQVSFLWDGKITYDDDEYRTYEKIIVDSSTILKRDPDQFNGTTYLQLPTDKPIKYVYVFADKFDKALSVEKPLVVNLLGKEYQIVNYTDGGDNTNDGDEAITLLSGVVGIAKADYAVEYGGYKFYAVDAPSTGDWVEVQVKDADGNIVADTIVNKNEVEELTLGGKTIQVKPLQVWASDISQKISAKLVVGEEVEKEIEEGTGDENVFPEGHWYLTDVNADSDGLHSIEISFIPDTESDEQYIKIGEKIVAPNNYFEVGYSDNTVKSFTQLTFEPVKGITVYDENEDKIDSGYFGIKVSADSNVFGSTQDYNIIYMLINDTAAVVAYEKDGKVIEEDEFSPYLASNGFIGADNSTLLTGKYDDTDFNITMNFDSDSISGVTLKIENDNLVIMAYANHSTDVYLGSSENEAENSDVQYGASNNIAKEEYKYVVTNYGAVIDDPHGNADNDKVVVKIPAEQQKGIVYVGRLGSTTTEGGTYKEYVPITTAIAKLDTEVNTASLDHNLVVVGGPCANRVAAELMGVNFGQWPECAAGIEQDSAIIKIFDDAFSSGKVAVLVAGYNAENTRAAASILQQYDTKLADIDASEVIVRGTEASTATIEPVTE